MKKIVSFSMFLAGKEEEKQKIINTIMK